MLKTTRCVALSLAAFVSTSQAVSLKSDIQIPKKFSSTESVKFIPDSRLAAGKHNYFVFFDDDPVALYQGGLAGFSATKKNKSINKLDTRSSAAVKYRSHLKIQQQSFLSKAAQKIQRPVKSIFDYQLSLNGVLLSLTQQEAKQLSSMDGVKRVQVEVPRKLHTDTGPRFIGAEDVWNGSGVDVGHKGEGIIIGVMDTGINTDNPSFAATGDDGFSHTNPKGAFFGDCVDSPALCNSKLIGVYSHPFITNQFTVDDVEVRPANGEDYNGHGSHTAGTAAGNVLNQVAIPDVDNNPSGVVFERISGVAPHANVVSFQVCEPDDVNGSCYPAITAAFVEVAIELGLDVINYSVGGSSSDPWLTPDALAFLAAREAGIHVAVSAGNEGPGEKTISSPADAPWVTAVAAYTHDRVITNKSIGSYSGGDSALDDMSGSSISGGITAPIVWAGDFSNPNDTENGAGECLQPFPAGTFDGQIVVCNRGAIPRVEKGRNVKAGGAGGFVLANVDAQNDWLANDQHVLPAIQLVKADGDALKSWLQSGTNHSATLFAAEIVHNDIYANQSADFTSRGPNPSVKGSLAPHVAAPGVNIFAAYADDKPAELSKLEFSDAADFSFLDGTSMASPHVAGALALIKGTRPDWTPAEAQSALMLTANPDTQACTAGHYCDSGVSSNLFDQGSGMVNVKRAINSGLIMDIPVTQYQMANPERGGAAKELNMAAMVAESCVDECVWLRNVEATSDGSWAASVVSADDGMVLSVEPAQFSLKTGEIQQIKVTADISNATLGNWSMGQLKLASSEHDDLAMPLAIAPTTDNVPQALRLTVGRDSDTSELKDLVSPQFIGATAVAYGFSAPQLFTGEVGQDSDPDEIANLEDGISIHVISLEQPAKYFEASMTSADTSSLDLDLYLFVDYERDGELDALVDYSWNAASNEEISAKNLLAGDYYLLVQNYQASVQGELDTYQITYSLVDKVADENKINVATSVSTKADNAFNLTLTWNDLFADASRLIGIVELNSETGETRLLRTEIERGNDDISYQIPVTAEQEVAPGETLTFAATVAANNTLGARTYQVTATWPAHLSLVEGSVTHGGSVEGEQISWTVEQAKGAIAKQLQFELTALAAGSGSIMFQETVDSSAESTSQTVAFSVTNAAPIAVISGNASVTEGNAITLDGTNSSDANGDSLTYSWSQTAGTEVSFTADAESISFTAPEVSADTTLSFQLTVSDGVLESTPVNHNVTVRNQVPVTQPTTSTSTGGGGGAVQLGLLALALVTMVRRKKVKVRTKKK